MNQKKRDLYTIILDFEGTTTIAQREGMDPHEALSQWFIGLADNNAYGLTPAQINALAAKCCPDFDQIVALSSAKSVWCTSLLVKDNLALFNIIRTK